MSVDHYVGTELELFAGARHWKAYFSAHIRPHLGQNVLEVGAGLGGTTRFLSRGFAGRWRCLEPDATLASKISAAVSAGELPIACQVSVGTLRSLPEQQRFDTISYIDVLEHIADDAAEAQLAASRLTPGGKLIVLSPAFGWLFSPLDHAVGHYRRYTKKTLLAAIPESLELVQLTYLDSVGLLASVGNRFVTRASSPSPVQMAVWDRLMVPASRILDPLLGHSFGRSLLGVWQKP